MPSLFDSLRTSIAPVSNWRPSPPPSLSGVKDVYLNFETTGLKWWEEDRPIALAVRFNGQSHYLPWGHADGNLDEMVVKRWAQHELRGKYIRNANTRFEVHMARKWGLDLEAQGNTVSDVQHYAALLDDHRYRFNIDLLVQDFLNEVPMARLDESRMIDYHSSEAAPRAMYNVEAVDRLTQVMWPQLDAQDLQQVRELEDQVIYPVVEMEENGFPIDLELLERWLRESQSQLNKLLRQLAAEVGFQCNPDSPKDQQRVFEKFGLPLHYTSKNSPSFTDKILKRIDHPTIKLMRKAGKLTSLRNKFIIATKKHIDSKGILRYALHQLRTEKEEGGYAGTVTGRFSSGEIIPRFGVNIQQRFKPSKQRVAFDFEEKDDSHDDEIFIIRKLHIAHEGQIIASDMDQAQYRIFASYINNPQVIQAYRDNPKLSFHKYMHHKLAQYVKLTYGHQKDLNFAYIFGAGLLKMSLMVGHITEEDYEHIKATQNYDHPGLKLTKDVKEIYERELPEVPNLLATAMHLAKPGCDDNCRRNDRLHRTMPHRGYVKTKLGRRMRFPDGQRLHKAFNGVDQGTEADVMKLKLVELHKHRKETGFTLRVTNHDEVVGDGDRGVAERVDKILNEQSLELNVPLTWETSIGPNWADVKGL